MNFEGRVTGAKELGGRMIGLGRKVSKPGPNEPLERAALTGGNIIGDEAGKRAPRSPGAPSVGRQHAADTVAARITESKQGRAVAAVGPGRRHFYLMFHEIGTSKMPARPWLVPSLESKEREAVRAAGQVMRGGIMRYVEGRGR